jgi:hypothetical protein
MITLIFPDYFKLTGTGGPVNPKETKDPKGNTGFTFPSTNASAKLDTWKADLLAELAYVLLRSKLTPIQNISFTLYEFLMNSRSNSLKGKIYLENLRAQIILLKLESDLKINAQPEREIIRRRIETRTESLRILERNLSGIGRLNEMDLLNETSMLIFNLSLPFMKRSLRKNFQKSFISAAEILEGINSNESQLRASIHFELAKCFLDEDLLQEADTHLIKALTLDYSLPQAKLPTLFPFKLNEPNTNLAYLQRNLEQYLVYLKRAVGVKTNIYGDPENIIDQIIFETDSIKNSKHEEVKIEKIKKCVELIQNFTIEEFNVKVDSNVKEKDFTEEEINDLKIRYDLKVYDDKKHFTLAALEIAKLGFEVGQYDAVLSINEAMGKFSLNWNTIKDIDQILALAEVNLLSSGCYENMLLNQEIEIGTNEIVCFTPKEEDEEVEGIVKNSQTPPEMKFSEEENEKFKTWKQNILNHLKEATRLTVSISQHWFLFNIAVRLWNAYLPIIKSPNFLQTCNDNVLPVMADLFEAMNSAMMYYESITAEIYDTDYFNKIDIIVNLTAAYCRLLDAKGRADECIRICDVMLSRKINSKERKIFDTIKARALKSDTGGKKPAASNASKAKPNAKNTNQVSYSPTPEQLLISDCFQLLETAIISKDEKTKLETLKKGIDTLKNMKLNYNDEACLELNAELWYKFGVQFFTMNNYNSFKSALYCADNCVKPFTIIDEEYNQNLRSNISHNLLKWYSVGYLLYSDSIYRLVDKDKQERLSQIKLYFTAIDKLIQAARIAERSNQYYVITQSIKAFYSVVIQVVDQPQSRENLVKKFQELHKILMSNKSAGATLYGDPEFLLLFYSIFCVCINETKNWELGEQIVNESLRIIPTSLHHFLLEHKLFYYSKLGKSFMQNLGGVENSSNNNKDSSISQVHNTRSNASPSRSDRKSSSNLNANLNNSTTTKNKQSTQNSGGTANSKDIMTKAKLFTKLAQSSTNKNDQFNAYTKAIDLLKNDSNILVCDVLFELSTWLYKNNYPTEDIEDNLLQAADILLEIEPMFEDDEDLDEENMSLHSKRSTSSRRSRISKRSKSRSKVSESKKRASVTNNSNKKSVKTRSYSNQDAKTKTVFGKFLEYDPYPLFLNISHLEQLFKIHVFLSISSRDYRKKQEYLLDAFYFIMKIIEISFKTLNCVEFYEKNKEEISKLPYSNELNPLASMINNYFINKDLNIPQVYTLPESLDNWINFNFPEMFMKKLSEENNPNPNNSQTSLLPKGTFISKKSFDKPYQVFFYLNYIIDKFQNEYYFHTQCIPLIKFSAIFSEFILENSELKYMNVLKLKRLYHNILQDNILTIIAPLDSVLNNNIPTMTKEKKSKGREELRKIDINLILPEESIFSNFSTDDVVIVVENLKDHVVWIELASEFFNHGYFNYAKDYLEESIFHSMILRDKSNFLKANLILAKINFVEAQFDSCFSLINKLQNMNTNEEVMYDVVLNILNFYENLRKTEEMIIYTNSVINFFENEKQTKQMNSSTKDKILSLLYIFESKTKMKKLQSEIMSSVTNPTTTQPSYISSMAGIINFYKNNILPLMKKFEDITFKNKFNTIQNIVAMMEYIDLLLETLISKNIQFTYISMEDLIILSTEVLDKCLSYLFNAQSYLNELQTFVPARVENSVYYLPMHRLIGVIKIKYASVNNLIGEVKNKIRREKKMREIINIGEVNSNTNQGEKIPPQDQVVIDYLNSLTKEINKLTKEESETEMNRYQKSIALLSSAESLLPPFSKEYISYFIEKINSLRLQSLEKKELKNIWDLSTLNIINNNVVNNPITGENNPNVNVVTTNTESNEYKILPFHQATLNLISEFEKEANYKLLSNTYYIPNFRDFSKYFYNILESSGYLNIELSFKSLCDYQNMQVRNYFLEVYERYSDPLSRDWVTLSSLNHSRTAFNSFNKSGLYSKTYVEPISHPDSILNYHKYAWELPYVKNLFSYSNLSSTWTDITNTLQSNTSYFVFQMNEERTILYLGFMYNTNGNFSYEIKRIYLDNQTNKKLDEAIHTIKRLKHILIKTVIVTKEDLNKIYEEFNTHIKDIKNSLEYDLIFSKSFKDLDMIINPVINEDNTHLHVQSDMKKKENVKTAPVKGKPNNSGNNNSMPDMILPTSNIESVTFLIDYRFYELPLEQISIFSKIPFKSNDFSIQCYVNRLKSNSSNNNISPMKYYFDYSSKLQMKCDIKKFIENKFSSATTTKGKDKDTSTNINEGVFSFDHYPSVPELQKLISSSGTFMFASQTSLLYQYPPYELLDSSKFSKCRTSIILDRVSTTKNFVDQKSLVPKKFAFSFQPLDLIALLTLNGVNTILTTKWSIDYDEVSELIEDILEGNSKGSTISYSVNSYRNPKIKKIGGEQKTEPEDKSKGGKKPVNSPKENKDILSKEEAVMAQTITVEKKEIFKFAPVIFGLNMQKLA